MRNIKDLKDLQTGELIYVKGHAQATFMSDGTTVEDAINNIGSGGGNNGANVQAIEIGDDIEDVETEYTTKGYVDGLIGDINSVLESIINSQNSLFPITLVYEETDALPVYNFLINKYGTSVGSQSSPVAISEEIYLQGFPSTGNGQVKFISTDELLIYLYLDDYRSTGHCCRINQYGVLLDFLWD